MILQSSVLLFQYLLAPVAPFSWFDIPISSLDLIAAVRLCYVLRHFRENLRDEHAKRRATDIKHTPAEDRSCIRDLLAVLTVVYGGEAIAGTSPCNRVPIATPYIIDELTLSRLFTRMKSLSPPPRRPDLVHDLGRRPAHVHPRVRARRCATLSPADDGAHGATTVILGRSFACNARMHTRPTRRARQLVERGVQLALGALAHFVRACCRFDTARPRC